MGLSMNTVIPLQPGETPIDNAPSVSLGDGTACVPQHYLLYQHTLESVENIVVDIEFNPRFPVFVCEDDSGLYIQVGIIGYDNYRSIATQAKQKLVYGRKWRVEPQLPTSEIVQTVFLALKKAREHEVRELFRFRHEGGITTPFNNHHDLPMIAQSGNWIKTSPLTLNEQDDAQAIQQHLDLVSYDSAALQVCGVEQRNNGLWLIDIALEPSSNTQLPEVRQMVLTLMLDTLTANELYYQLMDKFIALSDRQVDEHFSYKGFARFSRENSVVALSKLSSMLRKESADTHKSAFKQSFEKANYDTDETRVPKVAPGLLREKIKHTLEKFGQLAGLLPAL